MKLPRLVAALGVVAYGLTNCAAATPVPAADVKAAFIYNFARFAQWPAETLESDRAVPACILGDTAVADALERTARGHAIQGRALQVRVVGVGDQLLSCRLLYISGVDAKAAARLIAPLANLSTLTISDSDDFAESGGIAELFVEDGRMRFAINVSAARRARVALSANMLSLAKIVKEDRDGTR
jgi:YfiR/HmsC-like